MRRVARPESRCEHLQESEGGQDLAVVGATAPAFVACVFDLAADLCCITGERDVVHGIFSDISMMKEDICSQAPQLVLIRLSRIRNHESCDRLRQQ